MKRMNRVVLVVFSFFLFTAFSAQAVEYEFDKAHSSFRFGVQHIFSTVSGHFEDYSGKVVFDPANLSDSTFHFVIEVKSVQTQIGKRDNHLRSGDFFDAGKYPQITFASNAVTHVGGPNYNVAGKLTMKNVSKDIVLPVVYHGTKGHPMEKSKNVAGFDASVTINRLDYHVGDGKFFDMGVVGKDVNIFVSLEMLSKK